MEWHGEMALLTVLIDFLLQGFPEGHTSPCYPVNHVGVKQHRNQDMLKDSEAQAWERKRFALLGNAVTTKVRLPCRL